jgi:hypothetical protein
VIHVDPVALLFLTTSRSCNPAVNGITPKKKRITRYIHPVFSNLFEAKVPVLALVPFA